MVGKRVYFCFKYELVGETSLHLYQCVGLDVSNKDILIKPGHIKKIMNHNVNKFDQVLNPRVVISLRRQM